MRSRRNMAFIATFTLIATPSASLAGDSALVQGLIGGIFQTIQQQAQQQPAYNGGPRQFRVEDEAAERMYFRQEIQRRLNMLGYKAGYPDGRFGPQARSAIAAFQSDIDHRSTGKITENEISILYGKTNDPTVSNTPTQANAIQPTIVLQPQEKSQEAAPLSLAPIATLDPVSSAPAAAADSSSATRAKAGNNDTPISIQPSIRLPPTN